MAPHRGFRMSFRQVAASFCLAVIALIAITARSQAQSAPPKTTSKSTTPNLSLIDLAGYNQALAKYRGKPLLVTFWATWCEPCRYEFPLLVELAKQYEPQGLAVFGVSLDDDADLNIVRHFLAQNHPGFPSYRQKPGIDVDAFYRGVNPQWQGTMPETIFYGRDGRIAGHFVGGQTRPLFEQAIRAILTTRSSQNPPARCSVAGQ
jgi:thiol-disulfide isomerase/thioredoxin